MAALCDAETRSRSSKCKLQCREECEFQNELGFGKMESIEMKSTRRGGDDCSVCVRDTRSYVEQWLCSRTKRTDPQKWGNEKNYFVHCLEDVSKS